MICNIALLLEYILYQINKFELYLSIHISRLQPYKKIRIFLEISRNYIFAQNMIDSKYHQSYFVQKYNSIISKSHVVLGNTTMDIMSS